MRIDKDLITHALYETNRKEARFVGDSLPHLIRAASVEMMYRGLYAIEFELKTTAHKDIVTDVLLAMWGVGASFRYATDRYVITLTLPVPDIDPQVLQVGSNELG